jgi:serine phosphatase RsbU (regulator of sigma subunit)
VTRTDLPPGSDAGETTEWVTDPAQRATLLADVTLELTTTLDIDRAVGRLARLVVPQLADWSIVTLAEDDGSLHDVGCWHVDPALRDSVVEYTALRLAALEEEAFVSRAIRENRMQAVRTDATPRITAILRPGRALDLLHELAPASLLVLPMTIRGRTVGLLSLYGGPDRPPPSDLLIGVAGEIAARAALVVDNARAFSDAVQAREAAEQAGRRLALLSRVTEALSSTLDGTEAVERLARVVVPHLADWCVVTIARPDGSSAAVGYAAREADLLQDVAAFCAAQDARAARTDGRRPDDGRSALATVLRTGLPRVLTDLGTQSAARAFWPTEDAGTIAELRRRLAPRSAAILPLALRDRTLGALTLARTGPAPLDADELTAAAEIGRRAATALDNIRLYGQLRTLAEELQRNLLTEPPQPDHVEIAVRYVPAAHEAQVGGDWYDAFLQRDGSTMLTIGDVVGHDSRAAAAMGQVRTLLRGIAYTSGENPSAVLSRLDQALLGLQVDTTATAVLARLEQDDADAEAGVRRLRWSNAGHPPPVVRLPDGRVELLGGAEGDLLLGILPEAQRTDQVVELEAGSIVLLYTDGLVERRGMSLDVGLDRLRAAVSRVGDRPLQELCDAVLEQLLPRDAEDDVALVAVRLHPQHRSRPPEAGPTSVPPTVP